MTLAEKILHLRTAHSLSQGALAEKLDVSRQSVSKWETGQSVPDLDKLIRLSDLFGVTVDELVRDCAPSAPEAACPQPQPIAPQGKSGLTTTRLVGAVLLLLGGLAALLGLLLSPALLVIGLCLMVLSLPLLLARRCPWLIFGWLFWAALFLVLNPRLTGAALAPSLLTVLLPLRPLETLIQALIRGSLSACLTCLLLLSRSLLFWSLILATWRVCSTSKKARATP